MIPEHPSLGAFALLAFVISVVQPAGVLIALIVVVVIPSSQDPLARLFDQVIEIVIGSPAG